MALPEEDPELKDLVTQTLENNGLLKKIRAQLRAGVFLALEDSESREGLHLENSLFKEFVEKPEGAVITCLVREFLEYFGFDYTLSVFDPETGQGKEFTYPGRAKLANQIGLDDVADNKPLLGHILLNFENTINEDSIAIQENNRTFTLESESLIKKEEEKNNSLNVKEQKNGDNLLNKGEDILNSLSLSEKTLPLNLTLNDNKANTNNSIIESVQIKENEDKTPKNPILKDPEPLEHKKETASSENKVKKESSSLSLSDLPPLINQKSKENLGQLKAMVDLSLESTGDPVYEEDFEENINTPKESERQDSESEIQEEIEYVDDLLSLSTAVDDLTVTATISNSTGGPRADYSESI